MRIKSIIESQIAWVGQVCTATLSCKGFGSFQTDGSCGIKYAVEQPGSDTATMQCFGQADAMGLVVLRIELTYEKYKNGSPDPNYLRRYNCVIGPN